MPRASWRCSTRAVERGHRIRITVEGEDAQAASSARSGRLIENDFARIPSNVGMRSRQTVCAFFHKGLGAAEVDSESRFLEVADGPDIGLGNLAGCCWRGPSSTLPTTFPRLPRRGCICRGPMSTSSSRGAWSSPRPSKTTSTSCAGSARVSCSPGWRVRLAWAAIWWLSVGFVGWIQPMQFLVGALLLRESVILLRHARNLLDLPAGAHFP